MSGHVPALAALGCLALLLVMMLLSTDIYAFVSGRDAMPPAPPDPTAVQQTLQLRAALSAATHANMQLLSQFAELALPPNDRYYYWQNMGHIGQVPREVSDFAHIASQPGVRTICEIGFNAGHSASVFLTANPSATLYSFDLASLAYSSMSLGLFRTAYRNRFHWVRGSSFDTVPWFQRKNITCDVFSVDGDHTYESALTDFMNVLKVVKVGSVIIADDVSSRLPGCRKAWQEVLDGGYLRDVQCSDNGPEDDAAKTVVGIKRWCWGTVASLTGGLDSRPVPWPANTQLFDGFSFDPQLQSVGYVH